MELNSGVKCIICNLSYYSKGSLKLPVYENNFETQTINVHQNLREMLTNDLFWSDLTWSCSVGQNDK